MQPCLSCGVNHLLDVFEAALMIRHSLIVMESEVALHLMEGENPYRHRRVQSPEGGGLP